MHPRIQTRYVENLRERQDRLRQNAEGLISDFIGHLDHLEESIDRINQSGSICVEEQFKLFIQDMRKKFEQINLESSDVLKVVEELGAKLEMFGLLLNASVRLQAAKQNIDTLRSRAAEGCDQWGEPASYLRSAS